MIETNERKFLHDIASPLATALFQSDSLLDSLQHRPDIDPNDLVLAKQIYEALDKIKNMLQERREVLIKLGVPSARS